MGNGDRVGSPFPSGPRHPPQNRRLSPRHHLYLLDPRFRWVSAKPGRPAPHSSWGQGGGSGGDPEVPSPGERPSGDTSADLVHAGGDGSCSSRTARGRSQPGRQADGVTGWGSQAPGVGGPGVSMEPLSPRHRPVRATGPSEPPPPTPQDPLQDRLPPPPRAGPRPASLCLLPRLEADRRAAGGLWGR